MEILYIPIALGAIAAFIVVVCIAYFLRIPLIILGFVGSLYYLGAVILEEIDNQKHVNQTIAGISTGMLMAGLLMSLLDD